MHIQVFAEEPSRDPAAVVQGGTGAVAMGRGVSVPSFRERGLHT